jgi:hypothetical protein
VISFIPGPGDVAGEPTGLPGEVAAKAIEVADLIGGSEGFGGSLMEGYIAHAPMHMGFLGLDELADIDGDIMVRLQNDAPEEATFHLSYFAGHMGSVEQMMDVDVEAGGQVTVELPCAEILGVGPLDQPGGVGCHLADGETVDNTMAVPGFLGLDYSCGGLYECSLTPDIDDLDADGDTEELIITTTSLRAHNGADGPRGHSHMMGGM